MNRRISKLLRIYSQYLIKFNIECDMRENKETPNLYKTMKKKYKKMNNNSKLNFLLKTKNDVQLWKSNYGNIE